MYLIKKEISVLIITKIKYFSIKKINQRRSGKTLKVSSPPEIETSSTVLSSLT